MDFPGCSFFWQALSGRRIENRDLTEKKIYNKIIVEIFIKGM